MRTVGVAKIFESFQGEGIHSGRFMLFIRTSGCSVGCPQCDTDYRFKRKLTESDAEVLIRSFQGEFVWVTGGEPTDWPHVDMLAEVCKNLGKRPIMATSGIRKVSDELWETYCSPHKPNQEQYNRHNQVNLVPGLNGISVADCEWYIRNWDCDRFYITPMDGDDKAIFTCRDIVRRFPKCLLGVQAHKVWGVE